MQFCKKTNSELRIVYIKWLNNLRRKTAMNNGTPPQAIYDIQPLNQQFSDPNVELYDYNLKFVLVGDARVGKSRLMDRIVDNTFTDSRKSALFSFIFKAKLLDVTGLTIRTQIWDSITEEYRRGNKSQKILYSGAFGVIICFDLTNRRSFTNLFMWIQKASLSAPPEVILRSTIVGLKADLPARAVTYEEGLEFARKFDLSYYEISSLSGTSAHTFFTNYVTSTVLSVEIPLMGNPSIFPDDNLLHKVTRKPWFTLLWSSKSVSAK